MRLYTCCARLPWLLILMALMGNVRPVSGKSTADPSVLTLVFHVAAGKLVLDGATEKKDLTSLEIGPEAAVARVTTFAEKAKKGDAVRVVFSDNAVAFEPLLISKTSSLDTIKKGDGAGRLQIIPPSPPKPLTYEVDLGKLAGQSWELALFGKTKDVNGKTLITKASIEVGGSAQGLMGIAVPDVAGTTTDTEGDTTPTVDPSATKKETIDFLKKKYSGFQDYQVYRSGTTIYLFLNRLLQVAPGTAWPSCNEQGVTYQVVVVDKPAKDVDPKKYELVVETSVVRDPSLRFDGLNVAEAHVIPPPLAVAELAKQTVVARTGTLLLSATLTINGEEGNATRQSFRLPDCDLTFHVGIMLGVNASFLSTPTNIAAVQLPNSTNYTLVADDPTTHQALTVMALFYPTPRHYGYEYKELPFFQKFNVSVGSQVGPALLSDVLVGLNYEVARGLNFGAGGHYGRHRTIIGQPGFKFGEDVYAGGSSFTEAANTRMRWDLAWYVGLGIDLRVIGVLSGRDREVRDLRGAGPVNATGGTAKNGGQ